MNSMKKIFQKKYKGFTLIELLVVIAVIGMLASIVLVSLGPVRAKGRDARRQSDVRQISTAMELYYDAQTPTQSYPNLPDTATVIPANSTTLAPYLSIVPLDPTNTSPYQYQWTDAGNPAKKYCAWAQLESPSPATYIVASENGVKTTTTAPTVANCDTL